MSSGYDNEIDRLEFYAQKRQLSLTKRLGLGLDGIVYLTNAPSAVKALRFETLYENERNVYLRMQEREVERIGIFNFPTLIDFDDQLWVIEMSYVSAPFVVDFAGAYLDTPPPYFWDNVMMRAWERSKRKLFGTDWADVVMLLYELREKHGIYLNDVKPGNVTVRQEE